MMGFGSKMALAAVAVGLCGAFAFAERPMPASSQDLATASKGSAGPEYCRQPRNDAERQLNQAISSVLGCATRR